MSINSLTETEVRRSPDAALVVMTPNAPAGGAAPPPNNALSMLVKYIPTESVTLYVAATSAMPSLRSFSPRLDEKFVYWFCAVLTPVLFALILIGKRRAAGVAPLQSWPWWKNFAATVAFLVWALAVPGPPDLGDASGIIVGVLALFISTLLSVLEPVFDRPPAAVGGLAQPAVAAADRRFNPE